ncbi:hypothetical protein G3I38_34155 [Streptomyces sp. SID7958]|uniref:Integral membrane protein n=2 Tax=unclassified Streptomyces TaxID=2593676 RepID=A0A6G3QVQ3_9ACTN|nr:MULTISPECIES: hypothetical protein [unclassified Streptomyces]NEA87425.1 hypothetical protein [Streptomyces sp. SID14436]NEC84143.1 hypothetical protein [Streptomyces sp. SID7958]
MYGHGAPQPPRSAATVITLRVLITAAGFLSCGLLTCVPLFRVALLRGRTLDWAAAWASIPLSIIFLMVIGSLPESDIRTDLALALLLLMGAGAGAYFLTVDIRLHSQQRPYPGPLGHGTAPYGYPQPTPPPSPYATTAAGHPPMPQHPAPPVPPQQTPHPGPATPVPRPTGTPPAPQRIDQVRAELDELSDYLRRHDGHDGHHGPAGHHDSGR